MKTYTTLKQKASQTCDNNSNIFITTHKVVYKNGKKSSVELAESFISRDALDKVFVYTTPKMQRVKTNDTAIKCFIYIHTKLKNSKRPNLRFSYFELLDSLKRKSSTIENILKYLENDLRVINRKCIIKKSKDGIILSSLYISINYDVLANLFRTAFKNEEYSIYHRTYCCETNEEEITKHEITKDITTVENNSSVEPNFLGSYSVLKYNNRSIKQSDFLKKNRIKRFKTLDKYFSNEFLVQIQQDLNSKIGLTVEIDAIKRKMNLMINKGFIQQKFYSDASAIKYLTTSLKNQVKKQETDDFSVEKLIDQIKLTEDLLSKINDISGRSISITGASKIISNIQRIGKSPKFKNIGHFIKYMSIAFSKEKQTDDELNMNVYDLEMINRVKNRRSITELDVLLKRLSLKLKQTEFLKLIKTFEIIIDVNHRICSLIASEESKNHYYDYEKIILDTLDECFLKRFEIYFKVKEEIIRSNYDFLIKKQSFFDVTDQISERLKDLMNKDCIDNYKTWFSNTAKIVMNEEKTKFKVLTTNPFICKWLKNNHEKNILDTLTHVIKVNVDVIELEFIAD